MLDEDDWLTIRQGIEDSDGECNRWFDCNFAGEHGAFIRLAIDHGTSIIHARVDVPAAFEPKVEAALQIFQNFHVQPGRKL